MKKKLVAFALAAVCATGCAIGLSACSKDGGDGGTATNLTQEEWNTAIGYFYSTGNFTMDMSHDGQQTSGAKLANTQTKSVYYEFYYSGTEKHEEIHTMESVSGSPVCYQYDKIGDADWTRSDSTASNFASNMSSSAGIVMQAVVALGNKIDEFTVENGKYKAASVEGLTGATNIVITFNSGKHISNITCHYNNSGYDLDINVTNVGSTSITVPVVQLHD